jgi:hypothetical protein
MGAIERRHRERRPIPRQAQVQANIALGNNFRDGTRRCDLGSATGGLTRPLGCCSCMGSLGNLFYPFPTLRMNEFLPNGVRSLKLRVCWAHPLALEGP